MAASKSSSSNPLRDLQAQFDRARADHGYGPRVHGAEDMAAAHNQAFASQQIFRNHGPSQEHGFQNFQGGRADLSNLNIDSAGLTPLGPPGFQANPQGMLAAQSASFAGNAGNAGVYGHNLPSGNAQASGSAYAGASGSYSGGQFRPAHVPPAYLSGREVVPGHTPHPGYQPAPIGDWMIHRRTGRPVLASQVNSDIDPIGDYYTAVDTGVISNPGNHLPFFREPIDGRQFYYARPGTVAHTSEWDGLAQEGYRTTIPGEPLAYPEQSEPFPSFDVAKQLPPRPQETKDQMMQRLHKEQEHAHLLNVQAYEQAEFEHTMNTWMAMNADDYSFSDSPDRIASSSSPFGFENLSISGPSEPNAGTSTHPQNENQNLATEPDNSELAAVAQKLQDAVKDNTSDKFKKSKFFDMIGRIANSEVVLRDRDLVEARGPHVTNDPAPPATSGPGSGQSQVDHKGKGKADYKGKAKAKDT